MLMIEILHYLKDPKLWEVWSFSRFGDINPRLLIYDPMGTQNGAPQSEILESRHLTNFSLQTMRRRRAAVVLLHGVRQVDEQNLAKKSLVWLESY